MPNPTKAALGFPHSIATLEAFTSPRPGHPLANPIPLGEGGMGAANGFIAIRIERGRWLESDFQAPDPAALARFHRIPWGNPPPEDSGEWRPLDDVRGIIYRYAPISPWTAQGKPTPSPVCLVGGCFLARLSHLQLIARLPRVEIYAGDRQRGNPLHFRFTAGRGVIAPDPRLTTHSFELFKPSYHPLHGQRIERTVRKTTATFLNKPAPIPEQPIEDWPPAEPID